MIALIVVLVLACLVGVAVMVYRSGRQVVPAEHVGLPYRRFGTRAGPRFKRVTPYRGARGRQAWVLLPDQPHWLPPFLYHVRLVRAVHVPEGMIGLVTATDGTQRPDNQILGAPVACNHFQDGEAFLLGGGQQGRQLAALPGDTTYYLNTALFRVDLVPRTYVPPGTIGLVIAKAGEVLPPDRPLARYVPCNSFQDGEAFLRGGGQQGRQLAVLTGGAFYDINPAMFDVITVDNVPASRDGLTAEHLKVISIGVGYTGVVITLDGAEADELSLGPRIEGHRNFRLPWIFLERGGRRGVQQETLGEGAVYALNPWFTRVIPIPTRLLYLTWSRKSASEKGNFDVSLDQIVINIQGYRLSVEVSQALQITRDAAPRLVSQFGGNIDSELGGLVENRVPVQRFVERVLGATVAAYFNEIATASTIDEFLQRYASTRTNLTSQVRTTLQQWGVEAMSTTLGEFESEDPRFDEVRKREYDEQAKGKEVAARRANADTLDQIDAIEFRKEERRVRMELRAELDALGPDRYVLLRQFEEISKWKGPEVIGSNLAEYVDSMPLMLRRDLLRRIRATPEAAQSPSPAIDPGGREQARQLDASEYQDNISGE